MKKHTLKIVMILLFITSMFIASCEKEPIYVDAKTNSNSILLVEKFRKNFDPNQFTETLRYKYQVDWSNPVKLYSEQLKTYFYEFPIIYSDAFNPDQFNKLVKRDIYEKYKIVVIQKERGEYVFLLPNTF